MKKRLYLAMVMGVGLVVSTGCFSATGQQKTSLNVEVPTFQGKSNPVSQGDQGLRDPSKSIQQGTGDADVSSTTPATTTLATSDKEQAVTPASTPASHSATSSASSSASSSGTGFAAETNTETSGPANVSVDPLKAKYASQLQQLEQSYMSQLQGLYNEAMAAKQNGESKNAIYNTYVKQAENLQENGQDQVNQILFQMKNQLQSNNLPTDSVNQLRASFYQEVDKVKADMSAKIKNDK